MNARLCKPEHPIVLETVIWHKTVLPEEEYENREDAYTLKTLSCWWRAKVKGTLTAVIRVWVLEIRAERFEV